MFNPDSLHPLFAPNKPHPFKIMAYVAADRSDAEAARSHVGYFPNSALEPGDVVYIRGGDVTTQHFASMNQHEKKLALCLMGG